MGFLEKRKAKKAAKRKAEREKAAAEYAKQERINAKKSSEKKEPKLGVNGQKQKGDVFSAKGAVNALKTRKRQTKEIFAEMDKKKSKR